MKKVLFLFAFVAMGVMAVKAQENLKWGAMAGMNVSKYSITGFGNRVGFHAGVKAELGLTENGKGSGAYMDFAALLTLKGSKIDGGSVASLKFNPYYLEIPVRVGYKYVVNDDFSLFGSVGPYISVGLFGKAKASVDGEVADMPEIGSTSVSEDIFGSDGLKRFDCGFGLKAGLEFSKKYQVAVSYDFGLVDVAKGLGLKNRNLMFSLGYMF